MLNEIRFTRVICGMSPISYFLDEKLQSPWSGMAATMVASFSLANIVDFRPNYIFSSLT